jgi:hypothetical protein
MKTFWTQFAVVDLPVMLTIVVGFWLKDRAHKRRYDELKKDLAGWSQKLDR